MHALTLRGRQGFIVCTYRVSVSIVNCQKMCSFSYAIVIRWYVTIRVLSGFEWHQIIFNFFLIIVDLKVFYCDWYII